jgi:alkanesulfonate monooxygenase SsuD/methylene tetrahydromethanopterin reductase-like flavin-dependent oxidoreductase (luciferase family)
MDGGPPRWRELAALAGDAEEMGFDSLWVADTILVRLEKAEAMGYWECWSLLAALAAITSRVELGSLVTGGSFRNPVLLAHLVNAVEEISEGRVILGIGAAEVGQYARLGIDAEGRYGRLEEVLAITRAASRGTRRLRGAALPGAGCGVAAPRPAGDGSSDRPRHLPGPRSSNAATGGPIRPTAGTAGLRSTPARRRPSVPLGPASTRRAGRSGGIRRRSSAAWPSGSRFPAGARRSALGHRRRRADRRSRGACGDA